MMTSTTTSPLKAAKVDLLAPISQDMVSLNETIRASLHSDVPLVNQISEYLIEAGDEILVTYN